MVSLPKDRGAWLGLGYVKFDLISEHSGRMVQSAEGRERDGTSDGDFGSLGVEVIC